MLEARRLQLLHLVATAGSITRAARVLHYTPSAVSQQIAALERETGLQLMVRMPRGVRLTDAGKVLADHGAGVERHVSQARQELDALRTLGAGRMRIAAFPSAGATLVPRLVSVFTRRHPNVDVTLEIQEPARSLEALRSGLIDVALVFTYPFAPDPDFSNLEVESLLEDEVFVAVAADHELGGESALESGALADARWLVSTDPDCALMLRHVASRSGFEPRITFESDDYMTVGRLVAGGLGVALVPRLAADAMPDSVRLRPLQPSLVRNIVVVTTSDPTPPVSAMLAIAREELHAAA